jgi:hypothetical protein
MKQTESRCASEWVDERSGRPRWNDASPLSPTRSLTYRLSFLCPLTHAREVSWKDFVDTGKK